MLLHRFCGKAEKASQAFHGIDFRLRWYLGRRSPAQVQGDLSPLLLWVDLASIKCQVLPGGDQSQSILSDMVWRSFVYARQPGTKVTELSSETRNAD
jgi:hypothetical protein